MGECSLLLFLIAFSMLKMAVTDDKPQLSKIQMKIKPTCDYFCEHGGAKTETSMEGKKCRCYYDDCGSEGILYTYNDIIGIDPQAIQDAKRKTECVIGDKKEGGSESDSKSTDEQQPEQKQQQEQDPSQQEQDSRQEQEPQQHHHHPNQDETKTEPEENKADKYDKQCKHFCENGGATLSQMSFTSMECKCTYKECVHPIEYPYTILGANSEKDIQDKEKMTKCIKPHHAKPGTYQAEEQVPTKLIDRSTCQRLCKHNGFLNAWNEFSVQRKVCICYSFYDRNIFQAYNENAVPIELVKQSKYKNPNMYKSIYDGEENAMKNEIMTSELSCESLCKSPPSVAYYKWTHARKYSYSYYAASIQTCHCYNSKTNYCDYDLYGVQIRKRDD